MRFSTKTRYGLKAVLILASRHGEGSVSVAQIARAEGISVPYLEQILNALKRKALVKSVRGPQGGYVLSKHPSEISLEELFYAFEEAAFPDERPSAAPARAASSAAADRHEEPTDAYRIFWRRVRSAVADGLGPVTVKDLLEEARSTRRSRSNSGHTFHI
ncbi:MAG: HTH-type transcriptional regulator CymR [Candidatus Omnitrophica bacterium]|nr:HTH-type transcriptional regulator CymR [Candidatus Omnitrophota bacterium]